MSAVVPPSLDALRAPANGQILALAKPLFKRSVEAAFGISAQRASGRQVAKVFREKRAAGKRGEFRASFTCFPIVKTPPFLPATKLKEKTYGFLLLLEIEVKGKWFLGIFKHQSASLGEWLDDKATSLPRRKLTNAFGDGTTVKQISLQRMTVSTHELHAASYEAPDLRTSLPMMAASRCAVERQGVRVGLPQKYGQ